MCWSTSKYKDYHIAEVFYLLNVQVEKMLRVVPSLDFVNRGCLNIPKRQSFITKPLFYAIETNELCFLFFWKLQPPTQLLEYNPSGLF